MARRPLSSPAEAWGRDPPEENSSSGPTSEPVEFPSNEIINSWRGGNNTSAWHPKLTLYRLLVIFSTVGLGAAKAVTSYFNLTHTSITLEWILGVVVFLMLHILGTYEVSHTRRIAWLFEVDYLDYLWNFLHKFARIHRPYYRTDEDNSLHIRTSGRPLMTGYRLLLTSTVFIAGMSKSALVYGNLQTEATTVEWAFGVLVATGLYWLGLYETSSTKVYPTMFHVDHSAGAFYSTMGPWFCLHLIGISLTGALSYAFSCFAYKAYTLDFSIPPLPAFIGFMNKALFMTLPMIPCVCSLGCIFFLLGNLYKLSQPFLSRKGLVIFTQIHEKYVLPTLPPYPKERSFYLKRALIRQVVKLPRNLFFLFMILAVLVVCAWMTTQWIMVLFVYMDTMDIRWLFGWLLSSIGIVPAIRFYSYMVLGILYDGIRRFLVDVRKDSSVDQLDNEEVPV